MARFNKKLDKNRKKTTNLAGGVAFEMSEKQELVHAVLTTFLEDKFYESSDERIERINELVGGIDPEFTARLAAFARTQFNMRSASHLLIASLDEQWATGDDLIKRAIVASAVRPDDLTEIASATISEDGVLSKQVKRGIRNALLKFDRYQLAKYRGENKQISLVDLFNLTHPKVQHASKEQAQAWDDLINGNLKSTDTWETKISASKSEEEKKENWEELVLSGKIGYMALLRNLNNLLSSGVSKEVISAAAQRLSDPEQVKKSRQLPFRFYTAYQMVKGNKELSDAISYALDISVSNAPSFDGDVLIAIDGSGSMDGEPIEIATIFGATLYKNSKDVDLITFSGDATEWHGNSRMPVVNITEDIIRTLEFGGTNTSSVFEWAARQSNKDYKNIIIISDSESWQDSSWYYRDRGGTQQALNNYRKKTDSNPNVYCIDVQGYGTTDLQDNKVTHFTGWSDKILTFMQRMNDGSLVQTISEYEL